MMIKRHGLKLLVMLLLAGVLFSGCLPEGYTEWSDDGSMGLAKIENSLYLVEGETDKKVKIDEGEIGLHPFLSADGKMIAYSKGVLYSQTNDLLAALPEGQVNMVKQAAKQMRQEIISQGELKDNQFPKMEIENLGHKDSGQRELVIRYLCENADDKLKKMIPDEVIKEVKEYEMHLSCLTVGSCEGLNIGEKQVVTSSLYPIWQPRIAPDKKSVAYLLFNPTVQDGDFVRFDLYVASLDGDMAALEVAQFVSQGYDWRQDSREIVYQVREEGDNVLGTLEVSEVKDDQGRLLARPVSQRKAQAGCIATHSCQGKNSELAGIIWGPWGMWMKAVYGPGGRIFFSSSGGTLPTTILDDEPPMSIFCYDLVTGAITDLLPGRVSGQLGDQVGLFEVSPDNKRLLLPMKEQRFLIYQLGESDATSPISQADGFVIEQYADWKLLPAWKGNDQICCLVKKGSELLKGKEVEGDSEYAVVIIDVEGALVRILGEYPMK